MNKNRLIAANGLFRNLKETARLATSGPWEIWVGPESEPGNGHEDLCIGAGEDWSRRMSLRIGEDYLRRDYYMKQPDYKERCKEWRNKDWSTRHLDCPICSTCASVSWHFNNARFIIEARAFVPVLTGFGLDLLEMLRKQLRPAGWRVGKMEQLIARAERLADRSSPPPWGIWDGPDYCGGGADLCIGYGTEGWLFNMDHRFGDDYEKRVNHYEEMCRERRFREYKPSMQEKSDPCHICDYNNKVTSEQWRNAHFIVESRNCVPIMIVYLRELLSEAKALRSRQ